LRLVRRLRVPLSLERPPGGHGALPGPLSANPRVASRVRAVPLPHRVPRGPALPGPHELRGVEGQGRRARRAAREPSGEERSRPGSDGRTMKGRERKEPHDLRVVRLPAGRSVIIMRRAGILLALAMVLGPGVSHARQEVEVWTDRGNEAVYEPGDRMHIKVKSAEDAHVLVYEIDAEGYVRLLFPDGGGSGFLEGRQTYLLPPEDSDVELVVQQPVGECYIVAIASAAPFDSLPWYLRPYNAQAEAVGYVGAPVEEQGVT